MTTRTGLHRNPAALVRGHRHAGEEVLPGLLDVRAHQRRGGGRVAALDRDDQVAVVVDDRLEARGRVADLVPERGDEEPLALDQRERAGVARRLVDHLVELAVDGGDRLVVSALDQLSRARSIR